MVIFYSHYCNKKNLKAVILPWCINTFAVNLFLTLFSFSSWQYNFFSFDAMKPVTCSWHVLWDRFTPSRWFRLSWSISECLRFKSDLLIWDAWKTGRNNMCANAYCRHRNNTYYAKRALWMVERLTATAIADCVKYEELCSDYAENKQKWMTAYV